MKQLMPQSKIDEAASNATENRFDLKGLIAYGDIYEQGFRTGVRFTLNEVQPLMVEFAEWIRNSNRVPDSRELQTRIEKGWTIETTNEHGEDMWLDFKTTQQLFEEFINYKNKESEQKTTTLKQPHIL